MQLNLFDLNLLRALDVLLREKSVTRAADQLCVTQQAMSGTLKRLREHFSDELLVRIGQRLELTPQGQALVKPVRDVMVQIGQALETTPSFDPGTASRRFRIALSDYASFVLLPPAMKRLLAVAPRIAFDIQPIDIRTLTEVDQGELDLCVVARSCVAEQASDIATLRRQSLFEDDFVCIVDATVHPDLGELTIDAYAALPHCAVELDERYPTLIELAWTRQGIRPPVAASVRSFVESAALIAGTTMIATVQRRLAAHLAQTMPLRILPCPIRMPRLEEEMSWHGRNDADPAHCFLRDVWTGAASSLKARPGDGPSEAAWAGAAAS